MVANPNAEGVSTEPLPLDLDAFEEACERAAVSEGAEPVAVPAIIPEEVFLAALKRRAHHLKRAAFAARPYDAEIADQQAQIAELQAEVAKLTFERDAAAKPWQHKAANLEPLVEAFMRAMHQASHEKVKSWPTPYGTPKLRKQQPEWVYGDEKDLGKWLQANAPRFVKADPLPVKTAIKDAATVNKDGTVAIPETGEIIPGITVNERKPKFEIDG
ncbi:MAG TPA: host-nuclease inhibitor Gam family protein [Symbiobacteriaceae bacterium]|jgi:hypothetical protein